MLVMYDLFSSVKLSRSCANEAQAKVLNLGVARFNLSDIPSLVLQTE